MRYNRWEVWNARVVYDDDPETVKQRPVLIIGRQEFFVLSFKMTGTQRSGDYPVNDWAKSGLKKATYIQIHRVLKLQERDFISKRGELQPNDIIGVQKYLENIRNCPAT